MFSESNQSLSMHFQHTVPINLLFILIFMSSKMQHHDAAWQMANVHTNSCVKAIGFLKKLHLHVHMLFDNSELVGRP